MGERGRDEEREYERCERPEGPVEVRRRREVGRGVRGGEGVERVGAAEEDLYKKKAQEDALVYHVYTHGFGVDVEMVLVVVDTPERCVTGIRDVA